MGVLCRGKPLSKLRRELEEGFGCEGGGYVGGFSTSMDICRVNAMDIRDDDDLAAIYVAPYTVVKMFYPDLTSVVYTEEWFKEHPDILRMVIRGNESGEDDVAEYTQQNLDFAVGMKSEKEHYFQRCPLYPLRDSRGQLIGSLDIEVFDDDIYGEEPHTQERLNNYISEKIEPRIQGIKNVSHIRLLRKRYDGAMPSLVKVFKVTQ